MKQPAANAAFTAPEPKQPRDIGRTPRAALPSGHQTSREIIRPMRALLVCSILVSCTKANPEFCEAETDCANGFVCDLETHGCVETAPPPDPECSVEKACTDPLKPICGGDQTCRACALNDECDSEVCRSDGACEVTENVIYVAAGSPPNGDCLIDTPCELLFAKSKLSGTRSTIHLSSGTYSLTSDFVVDALTATIVGNRDSVLQASGAFRVANGGVLALVGFSLEREVTCIGGTLHLERVNFDHPPGGATQSWVTSTNCSLTVDASEIINSPEHGISITGGAATVTNTRIELSKGNGILCTSSMCAVSKTVIRSSQQIGIDATPVSLQLSRSEITENKQGGVRSLGGTCDITNNFVFRNGNDKNGTFGGMRLEPGSGMKRIEHNTIVFNDSDPFASPAFAGGLFCKNAGAPNNIIYNNTVGNNTMPNSQTGGVCNFTGSLIVNGNGTNELHFISPVVVPFNYHLADDSSPAANSGMQTTVTEDFDGTPRGNPPDIGADEFGD